MPRLCRCILGSLLFAALTACASTRFPLPDELPLVLDARSNPAWRVETRGRTGAVEVTFRARDAVGCDRLGITLREHLSNHPSMDALGLELRAMPGRGVWTLAGTYRDRDDNLNSRYDDTGLPLAQEHVILLRWRNRNKLQVMVNGDAFIDDSFGERVRYVELTSRCGTVDIVDFRAI